MGSEILSFLAGAGSFAAFTWWFLKGLIKKKVDIVFDKKLEDHKHGLTIITEKTKHEFQKNIHSFTLYNTEKHSIYPELYKSLLVTKGKVDSLRIAGRMSFRGCNEQDIMNYMASKNFPDGKVEEILELWRESLKDEATIHLNKYGKYLEEIDAHSEIQNCYNHFFENELFLSNELSDKIQKFINRVYDLYNNYLFPDVDTRKTNPQLKKELDERITEIKNLMRQELLVEE